jgi:hypothetical protein
LGNLKRFKNLGWIEAWVTVAVDDDEALKALILAESLHRSGTAKKLMVIYGKKISNVMRYVS